MSLAWASGRQQTSLCDGSGWHTGSQPPSEVNLAFLFSLITVVVICLTDCTDLGDSPSRLSSQLSDPQNPGACISSLRAPGKAREARRGFCYLPKQGPVSIPQLLGLLLPDGKRVRATLTLAELSCTAFLSWMQGCNSTSRFLLTLLDNLQPPHFLCKILHLFTPHAVLFPLSSSSNSRFRYSLQPSVSWGALSASPHSCQQWLLSVCELLMGLIKLDK